MTLDLAHIIQLLVAWLDLLVQGDALSFLAKELCDDCPGAESTLVAAAWANIAYMTHAALLHYVNFTGFGLWAPLLYAVGAVGALVAVAINSPPRNYTWFVLGPAIYGFLVGATQEVRGVDWVVAGEPQDMQEVWRDAETGMRNSPLLQIEKYQPITISKDKAPTGKYPVAMPMLFFDELFSATSNMLVEWTGLYRKLGEGGNNSNLAKNLAGSQATGSGKPGEGPWYLMSNLKAPMVENITSAHIRNPQLRDAFVTFLASECGDSFKSAVNAGAYNAANMARGSKIPKTIMIDSPDGGNNDFGKSTGELQVGEYRKARFALNSTEMPTPRSLLKLLSEPQDTPGSLGKFSPNFQGSPNPLYKRYSSQISCSTYLWTIIQGMRHEMGHAYYQLIRSAPRGFRNEDEVLSTLFYGWDIRKSGNSEYATGQEMGFFAQNLIFTYMLKNEMQFAPQITATEQKFAPSDSTIGFSNAYVGSIGAKTKSSELYNWAVMMPHIQGILLYVIIVGYPFAAMAMIIPGYWKGFMTWVSFFAWIKLWDVGFAVVQVLERSVWAMMGNHSNMARVANMLIQTGWAADNVTWMCGGGSDDGSDVMDKCAVPDVMNHSGEDQEEKQAMFYLDKALLLGAAIDLDVSNGYYLYIMAALYFAVPAVTGQLVLGAKAGLGGLLTNSLSDGARDISGAAKSGIQGDKSNQITTAKEAISQAASAKAYRSPTNAFLSSLQASNAGLDLQKENARLGEMGKAFQSAGSMAGLTKGSFDSSAGALAASGKFALGNAAEGIDKRYGLNGKNAMGESTPGPFETTAKKLGQGWSAMQSAGSNFLGQNQMALQADAMKRQANMGWDSSANGLKNTGLSGYSQNLSQLASFQAESEAWDARNQFAINSSGMAGVYGVNTGSLNPGSKPTQPMGMAMSGMLGQSISSAAHYSGNSFLSNVDNMRMEGKSRYGASYLGSFWSPTSTQAAAAASGVPGYALSAGRAEMLEHLKGQRNVNVANRFSPQNMLAPNKGD